MRIIILKLIPKFLQIYNSAYAIVEAINYIKIPVAPIIIF